MGKYPEATVIPLSGKSGWYANVTIPQELRPFFNNQSQKKLKIRGAKTKAEAYDLRREAEAQIHLMFDEADLANHPLPKAANALQEMLKDGVQWEPKDWFDPVRRWEAEDDVRSRVGKAIAIFNRTDKLETSTDRVAALVSELDLPYLSPDELKEDLMDADAYALDL